MLTYFGITMIGEWHRRQGKSNQDALFYECIGDDFVLTCSDGLSSSKYSEIGSEYAMKVCSQVFHSIEAERLSFEDEAILLYIIETWRQGIGENSCDYYATLKLVLKKGMEMKMISLGDGFVALASETVQVISPCSEIGFINETKCLGEHTKIEDFWIKSISLEHLKSYIVLVCTDGVANGIEDGKELEFMAELEKQTDKEALKSELEEVLEEIGNYSADDKTIGIVKFWNERER